MSSRSQQYPPRKRPRGDFYNGGDRYNRPPREEGILTRLRKDFISLADPKAESTAADDVDWVAKGLVSEYGRGEQFTTGIHDLLFNCVLEMPPKIPFYASLFVVANARKPAIGKDVVEFSLAKLSTLLESGHLFHAKLLLRFIAGLARIIEEDGIIRVLEPLAAKVDGKQSARTDSLAQLILLTLPYIAVSPKAPIAGLNALFEQIAPYMEARNSSETSFVSPFKTPRTPLPDVTTPLRIKASHSDELVDFSALHLLWLQTKTLKEQEWDIPFLPRPWFAFRTELESSTQTHPLPEFSPSIDNSTIPALQPEYYFSIFLNNEKHTVPQLDHIAATLIRDVISDTITTLPYNRKESARLLIDLQTYFPTGLFHRLGIPVKDLPPPGARPKFKLEDVLVDALFAAMFRVPRAPEREVYYYGVVTEVTKLAPGEVAPTLGRGIRWLFERVGDMRGVIGMRFGAWFALHLSNFGFTYKWEEWIDELSLPDNDPKKVFLRETLEKEVRLSYVERIQRTLPEEYACVLPGKPDVEDWKSVAQRRGAGEDSEMLIEALRARDDAAVTAYLDSHPAVPGLLVTALLHISHETPYSAQIAPSMVELVKKSTSGVEVVNGIMKFWTGRESTGTVLAMRYVDLGCCTVADVVEWLLQQGGWTDRAWGWELVPVCVEKIDTLAAQAQNGENANGEGGEKMEVDSSANGVGKEGRREILGKIVEGVQGVYDRAEDDLGREWVKEWFRMIVGTYYEDFAEFEAAGWVGDILHEADDFRKLLA